MTTYALTGAVIDDEGVTTIINEFTTSAARAVEWISFYTGNGLTGTLILTTTDIDGIKANRRIVLDGLTGSLPELIINCYLRIINCELI